MTSPQPVPALALKDARITSEKKVRGLSEGIRWEMGAEEEWTLGVWNLGFSLHCFFFFFFFFVFYFCNRGLFQSQTYIIPIRGSFERGW